MFAYSFSVIDILHWNYCIWLFMFLLTVSSGFTLVLDPSSRLGRQVGSACEELEDSEGGIFG